MNVYLLLVIAEVLIIIVAVIIYFIFKLQDKKRIEDVLNIIETKKSDYDINKFKNYLNLMDSPDVNINNCNKKEDNKDE